MVTVVLAWVFLNCIFQAMSRLNKFSDSYIEMGGSGGTRDLKKKKHHEIHLNDIIWRNRVQ